MKNNDFTDNIPEIGQLIEITGKMQLLESIFLQMQHVQTNLKLAILDKLEIFEQDNSTYLGTDLLVRYKKKHFLIKGMFGEGSPPVSIVQLEHLIEIKSKQTKGTEGEKAKA